MEQRSGNLFELAGRIIGIRPHLPGQEEAFSSFCRLLTKLVKVADNSGRQKALETAREEIESLANSMPAKAEVALKFACSVVVDMVAQGWGMSVTKSGVELRAPRVDGVPPEELKRRIREGHLLERDAQLREPSVREFIKSMEQRRLGPQGWVSIFSLMRDGRGLSQQLESAAQEASEGKRLEMLRSAVSPYLQVVESEARCEFTGLKLTDVWRYFRHTWVNTYKSLPGRGMMVLVRDAAASNHPVIGIAALGSSMAQQTLRDSWIGWDSEKFVADLCAKPTARIARWVKDSVERLISGIYIDDLLNDGIVERHEIREPTGHAISRLLRELEQRPSSTEDFRVPPSTRATTAMK